MPAEITICTIPGRYCPAPALLAAALLWRASKIETLPSLAAPAMRIGAGCALAVTALSIVTCYVRPKLRYVVKIHRID